MSDLPLGEAGQPWQEEEDRCVEGEQESHCRDLERNAVEHGRHQADGGEPKQANRHRMSQRADQPARDPCTRRDHHAYRQEQPFREEVGQGRDRRRQDVGDDVAVEERAQHDHDHRCPRPASGGVCDECDQPETEPEEADRPYASCNDGADEQERTER